MSKVVDAAKEAAQIAQGNKRPARAHGPAMWTYDFDAAAWYVRIEPRRAPPYLRQVHVEVEHRIATPDEVAQHRPPQLAASPCDDDLGHAPAPLDVRDKAGAFAGHCLTLTSRCAASKRRSPGSGNSSASGCDAVNAL